MSNLIECVECGLKFPAFMFEGRGEVACICIGCWEKGARPAEPGAAAEESLEGVEFTDPDEDEPIEGRRSVSIDGSTKHQLAVQVFMTLEQDGFPVTDLEGNKFRMVNKDGRVFLFTISNPRVKS